MKIAIVSDIHNGGLIEHRPGEEALGLLSDFTQFAKDEGVEFILELGDRVNNHDHDSDIKNLKSVVECLSASKIPFYSAIGNHDIHYMSKKENLEILSMDNGYYSFEKGGIEFIVLDSTDKIIGDCGGYVSDEQIKWLDDKLASLDTKAIICSHHPFFEQNQNGNPFFERIPGEYKTINSDEVIEVIKKHSDKILALLNGHVHWNYAAKVAKIPCFSVASLLENYPLIENAPGRFTILDITEDKIYASSMSINPKRAIGMFELR